MNPQSVGSQARTTVSSLDGTTTVIPSGNSLEIWQNGALQRTLQSGIDGSGRSTFVAISPDGLMIAGGFLTGNGATGSTVEVWDVQDGALKITLTGFSSVQSVAFSPDGSLLAGVQTHFVRLFDTQTWTEMWSVPLPGIFVMEQPSHVAFSPDGTTIAVALSSFPILYSVQTGVKIWPEDTSLDIPGQHFSKVVNVAFSPDGKTVASVGRYGDAISNLNTCKLWRVP